MSPINCASCGCLNGSRADDCERCGTPLIAAAAGAGSAPLAASAAPVVSGERLPIDFPFEPFQSVGDALKPTFRLYRERFPLAGKIVFAATLPLTAANYAVAGLVEPAGWGALAFVSLASVFVNSLMDGALIYAVVTLLRTGAAPSLAESYTWGLRRWWPLFLCTLLMNVLTGVGFVLLVIPGIILSLMFAVAVPVVVIENRGPVAALERSAQLTKGNRVLILFTSALLWVVVSVAAWLTADHGGAQGVGGTSFFESFVYAGINQMLNSAYTVLSLHLYLGIRADKGETVSTYDALTAPAAGALSN
jgi:hypothetical protein